MEAIWQELSRTAIVYGGHVLLAIIVLIVGWIFSGWVSVGIQRALTRARFDVTLTGFLSQLGRWSILLLVVIACLGLFGIETTSFAAVIGSAGIAIGLAFQGTLSNFAAGVMLLAFRPFRVGDVITVAGQTGTVHEIELFTTRLDTADNRRFIIPNGQIFGATIENVSHHSRRRADVNLQIDHSADIDRTRDVLFSALKSVPGVLTDPTPAVSLNELTATATVWSVQAWARASELGDVKQVLIRAVKLALDEAAIPLATPRLRAEVHPTVASPREAA